MQVLITGGAGFIGAALSNTLTRDGHQVRVIDDLSAGDPARLDPKVLFTRGDVADVPKLWTLLQDVECVYHLAARVSVPESVLYPKEYNAVNVGGTVSVMEAMRDVGVRRVVLASSGAVYGEQASQPLREDMAANPDSPYAVSKLAAEYYVRTIGDLWGIETVCLRLFNAYGPGQQMPVSHAPVIPRYLLRALTEESLVLFGDGQQTRDYLYVDDAVGALVAAATAAGVNREIINVGSGQETSVEDLVQAVASAVDKRIEPLRSSDRDAGVSRMRAATEKARDLLGFVPQTTLEQGLRLTLQLDPRFQAAALAGE